MDAAKIPPELMVSELSGYNEDNHRPVDERPILPTLTEVVMSKGQPEAVSDDPV